MQFQPNTKGVEVFGVQEDREMTIAITGKTFYTFISGLYSRKIESIVREITSNARDGHTKKGNLDRPFFVHSPTRWEPYFSVRDFGTSIPHDVVMDYCSQIGWSSKEKSDEEIGTWGYGMKSPFAYTSQFSIACWSDGEMRLYSYFVQENGRPKIVLRDRRQSDDETGVEVRFDVKIEDISAFEKAIRWAALPYDPCFESNLSGVHAAAILDDSEIFFHSDDVSEGPYVQIGPVFYRIDATQVEGNLAPPVRELLKDKRLILRTKIGDLGVPPSREALEYTPKTISNLTRYITEAHDRVRKRAEEMFKGFTTIWEAAEQWEALPDGLFRWITQHSVTPFGPFSKVSTYEFPGTCRGFVNRLTKSPGGSRVLIKENFQFLRGSNTAVYVFDEGKEPIKAWQRRIVKHMTQNGVKSAYHILLPDPHVRLRDARANLDKDADRKERKKSLSFVWNIAKDRRDHLLKAISEYGCPMTILAEDLPQPDPVVRKSVNTSFTVYAPEKYRRRWQPCPFPTLLKEDETHIVFLLDEGLPAPMMTASSSEIRRVCGTLGKNIGALLGVAKTRIPAFLKAHPEFILASDFFVPENFDVPAIQNVIVRTTPLRSCSNAPDILRLRQAVDYLPSTPKIIADLFDAFDRDTVIWKKLYDEKARTATKTQMAFDDARMLLRLIGVEEAASPADTLWDATNNAYEIVCEAYPRALYGHKGKDIAISIAGMDVLREKALVDFHLTQEWEPLPQPPQAEIVRSEVSLPSLATVEPDDAVKLAA